MQKAPYTLGIDLGGTKIAGAVLSETGQVLAFQQRPTEAQRGQESVYSTLLSLTNALLAQVGIVHSELAGVGIGVPGVVTETGTVEWAPALLWKDFPLACRLRQDLGTKVVVENDVRLQALGEYNFGACRGADPMAYLAIGTGLGSGIIINGRLHLGYHRTAGEVCNMLADRSQLGKDLGGFGGLELYASGTGLARLFCQRYPGHPRAADGVTGEQVCTMAREGSQEAAAVIQEFAEYLALAVVNLSVTVDPEIIVIGGGVARAADLFLPRVMELVQPVIPAVPRLAVSELGTMAGPLGALALLRSR